MTYESMIVSVGLGLFVLLLIHLFFPVCFKLNFVEGKPIVTISKKFFLLPFTDWIRRYENLQRVCVFSIESASLGRSHASYNKREYCFEMIFPKKRKVVFRASSRKELAKYSKEVNDALRNTIPYEITRGTFIYKTIVWFNNLGLLEKFGLLLAMLIILCPIMYIIIAYYASRPQHSNLASLQIFSEFVFFNLLPVPIICSILSLGVNFLIKKKNSADTVNNKVNIKDSNSNSDPNNIYDSIIK